MVENDFTRCNLRVPQPLYEKIEAIARANGAKINSRSKRPQISSTLIELLQIGLEHYSPEDQAISEDSSSNMKVKEEQSANTTTSTQSALSFEPWNQMLENQQKSQQTIEQQLLQIQTSQQLTQTDINHLYHLVGRLFDCLNASTVPQVSSSSSQFIQDQPLAASLDQWTVNRQWLNANGCFSSESFDNWQNGEVRQDPQGRYWRRVELCNVLGDFQIPSDLATSQVFYVLEDHH